MLKKQRKNSLYSGGENEMKEELILDYFDKISEQVFGNAWKLIIHRASHEHGCLDCVNSELRGGLCDHCNEQRPDCM